MALIFLLLSCNLLARTTWGTEDDLNSLNAIYPLKYIQDPSGELKFEDILSMDHSKYPDQVARFTVNKGHLWVVIPPGSLKDVDPEKYFIALVGNASRMSFYYYSQFDQWTKMSGGANAEDISDLYSTSHPGFSFKDHNKRYPIYLKLSNYGFSSIVFERSIGLDQRISVNQIFTSLILGALIFIVVINTYRSIISRNTMYLLYASYIVSFVFVITGFTGNNLIFNFINITPYNKFMLNHLGAMGIFVFGGAFGIRFLDLRKSNRFFYYLILACIALYMPTFVLMLYEVKFVTMIGNITGVVVVVVLFAAGLNQYLKGHKYVIYYVIAYLLYTVIMVIFTYQRNTNPLLPYMAPIPLFFTGFVIEGFLINVSLNRSIDYAKKEAEIEKERSQKELLEFQEQQNEILEKQVLERTHELEHSRSDIIRQNNELKLLSAELNEAYEKIKENNEELKKSLSSLQKAQDQLIESEKMASIGTLTSGLAHELNNPLGYIGGVVHPLKLDLEEIRQTLPEEKRAETAYLFDEMHVLLDNMSSGVTKATQVIKNLLEISPRGEASENVKFNVKEILNATLNLMKKASPVHIESNIPEDVFVVGNQIEINQVFVNIIKNGIEAIPDKRKGHIKIDVKRDNDKAQITITDNGVGISGPTKGQLFEPFFTTKAPGKGTGLGLYVSYTIIRKHHGDIIVTSEPGKGTEFKIELPLEQN